MNQPPFYRCVSERERERERRWVEEDKMIERKKQNSKRKVQKNPLGLMVVNVLDFDTVECKFELQSRYYIHFRKKYPCESYKQWNTPSLLLLPGAL